MTTLDTRPITEPGLVHDMPLDAYLADPVEGGSLSHSGAKTLVNKTPALFAYEREHGREPKRSFDLGHAAHREVLGEGYEIVIVQRTFKDGSKEPAEDYRSASAQEHRDALYAEGKTPLLAAELDTVRAMAHALRTHPAAAKVLDPTSGDAEVSAFVPDPETGVWLRSRFDWLRRPTAAGKVVVADYKTTDNAEKEAFARSAANFGYHLQDAFYRAVATYLHLGDDVAFLFVAQEKTPPYLVNVIQLDVNAQAIGERQMRKAIDLYKSCTDTGQWPGYGSDITLASLPAWYERKHEMDLS